jgi:hypothetical protein
VGTRLESSECDRAATPHTLAVGARRDAGECGIDLREVLARLCKESLRLGPLERQRGALWVVFVVGGGVATSSKKRTHLLGEALNEESGLLPVPCEVIPQ